MTDPVTNEPTGIHRTFLNPDGKKIERKMLGRQGVVRVTPDEDVTYGLGIAEGVEDAIAVALDWGACMGRHQRRAPLSGFRFSPESISSPFLLMPMPLERERLKRALTDGLPPAKKRGLRPYKEFHQ